MPRQARKNDIKLPEMQTNRFNFPAHALYNDEWMEGRDKKTRRRERTSDRDNKERPLKRFLIKSPN